MRMQLAATFLVCMAGPALAVEAPTLRGTTGSTAPSAASQASTPEGPATTVAVSSSEQKKIPLPRAKRLSEASGTTGAIMGAPSGLAQTAEPIDLVAAASEALVLAQDETFAEVARPTSPEVKAELVSRLKTRESLGDTAAVRASREPRAVGPGLFDPGTPSSSADETDEQTLIAGFDVPMGLGRMNVLSQELDANGEVTDVRFMSLDTDSKWEMDVDIDDGAILEFKRPLFGDPAKRPFKNRAKKKTAIPGS